MSAEPQNATIISELTGDVIGGRIERRLENGSVVILFAGMERTGKPLTPDDITDIEADRWTGEPLLRAQR